jgi:hypothetical protein
VAIQVRIDPEHGGRWTSLRAANGREWLWLRQLPERDTVQPGDPFVDAGGLEECIPTIGGVPDHGDAWARPWVPDGDALVVHGAGYELRRRITTHADSAVADYRLQAEPGWRFIWAAHALIDVSTSARLLAPPGHAVVVGAPGGTTRAAWPGTPERDLSLLGPADGTALMLYLLDLHEITVVDGSDRLTMRLRVSGQPAGIAIWRNLGGWPEPHPYRSIGVEPLLGHAGDLTLAGPGQTAVVPRPGILEWSLLISTTGEGSGVQPAPPALSRSSR